MRICLYRGVSLTSKLIRWRTWSVYSHASIWSDGWRELEAWQRGGVHINPHLGYGHTPGTEIDVFAIRGLTDAQEAIAWSFAVSQLGKAYDFHGVAGFISRRDGANNKQKWFCSEIVFAALDHAGIKLLARTEAHRVDPGLLALSPLLIEDGFTIVPSVPSVACVPSLAQKVPTP